MTSSYCPRAVQNDFKHLFEFITKCSIKFGFIILVGNIKKTDISTGRLYSNIKSRFKKTGYNNYTSIA